MELSKNLVELVFSEFGLAKKCFCSLVLRLKHYGSAHKIHTRNHQTHQAIHL